MQAAITGAGALATSSRPFMPHGASSIFSAAEHPTIAASAAADPQGWQPTSLFELACSQVFSSPRPSPPSSAQLPLQPLQPPLGRASSGLESAPGHSLPPEQSSSAPPMQPGTACSALQMGGSGTSAALHPQPVQPLTSPGRGISEPLETGGDQIGAQQPALLQQLLQPALQLQQPQVLAGQAASHLQPQLEQAGHQEASAGLLHHADPQHQGHVARPATINRMSHVCMSQPLVSHQVFASSQAEGQHGGLSPQQQHSGLRALNDLFGMAPESQSGQHLPADSLPVPQQTQQQQPASHPASHEPHLLGLQEDAVHISRADGQALHLQPHQQPAHQQPHHHEPHEYLQQQPQQQLTWPSSAPPMEHAEPSPSSSLPPDAHLFMTQVPGMMHVSLPPGTVMGIPVQVAGQTSPLRAPPDALHTGLTPSSIADLAPGELMPTGNHPVDSCTEQTQHRQAPPADSQLMSTGPTYLHPGRADSAPPAAHLQFTGSIAAHAHGVTETAMVPACSISHQNAQQAASVPGSGVLTTSMAPAAHLQLMYRVTTLGQPRAQAAVGPSGMQPHANGTGETAGVVSGGMTAAEAGASSALGVPFQPVAPRGPPSGGLMGGLQQLARQEAANAAANLGLDPGFTAAMTSAQVSTALLSIKNQNKRVRSQEMIKHRPLSLRTSVPPGALRVHVGFL